MLTFQEEAGVCFEPVRQRIRKSYGHVRTGGEDYLPHALLDAVIDSCFPVVDTIADKIDQVEEEIELGGWPGP